jgi:polyisoprenoid-binding protein YceI
MSDVLAPDQPPTISDGVWHVDPQHSEIGFAVPSMYGLVTVRGTFDGCSGRLTVAPDTTTGELSVDAASLDTGNQRRDRHLRSADFFDAERHPQIVFTATGLAADERGLTVAGELRIGSTVLPLEVPVEVNSAEGDAIVLDARPTISRAATGLTWNMLGMIGDEARLTVRITLTH